MHIKELPEKWASTGRIQKPVMNLNLQLPLELSANLMALKDIYPGRTLEQLLLDLLTAAIDELEESFPYKQGIEVIAEDEFGDPMYQDIGLTPCFLELTKFYRNKFTHEPELKIEHKFI
ncbi:MAG: type 1 pili tip component [Gammaproteobacteria bacterium]|nr:type 1 pili tip component [Gammaproteobacteria bacterium]MCW8988647.1 type 1 pili tip component [Gammaproteobacteria bacterium]MCW9030452.1 type 1 pili tip component [Gammaproteobacteria bacterium]